MGTGARLIDLQQRDFDDIDGQVCADCLTDPYLATWAMSESLTGPCSFCHNLIARSLMDLFPLVMHGIRLQYEDPAESVPYDSREGGYQVDTTTTFEILADMGITESQDLLEKLAQAIGLDREWVPINWAQPDSPLSVGWGEFKRHVETERRYTFLQHDDPTPGDDSVMVRDVPGALCGLIERNQMIHHFPKGTKWWRARPSQPHQPYTTAKELGPAPAEFAKDNRMTPKGIGVFNGSDTFDGALAEVASYAGATQHLSLGQFEQFKPLKVVDLRQLPEIPPIFDLKTTEAALSEARFLHDFVADITKPTPPGDNQNLQYIASQIIAEFFRYTLLAGGITWISAADHSSTVCSLFIRNDQTAGATKNPPGVLPTPPILGLVADSPTVRIPYVTWIRPDAP